MGADAWATIPSKDGRVGAVATSTNLFFGRVCLIQANRWTSVVGAAENACSGGTGRKP
jgi:restriction system protein